MYVCMFPPKLLTVNLLAQIVISKFNCHSLGLCIWLVLFVVVVAFIVCEAALSADRRPLRWSCAVKHKRVVLIASRIWIKTDKNPAISWHEIHCRHLRKILWKYNEMCLYDETLKRHLFFFFFCRFNSLNCCLCVCVFDLAAMQLLIA